MTGKGITLKRLLATGETVDRAEVEFEAGLSVVGYFSQTGKSYVVECIDYMLGGKTPPRNIKQSKGYDTLWLEFKDTAGRMYVLRRPLSGGPFRLYTMPLADVTDATPSRRLSVTKKAKTSAAAFLMDLAGFPNAKLKTNASNQKGALSFRTILHFFIVDEISMIDDPSPIHSRHVFAPTTERSAFKFLLTGKDDSDLEEVEKETPEDLADRVRREVYDELIRQLEAEIQQLRGNSQGGASLQELEQRLEVGAAEVAETSASISEQTGARREAWLELQAAESRLLVLDELLARFVLLRSHYDSDLKRLDFISEGQHYLDQLETIACPLCGAPLADHSPEPCDGDAGALSLVSVRDAFEREAEKIRTHVGDLEGTVGVLRTEHQEVTGKATVLGARVSEIDQLLSNHLAPRMTAAKSQVEELAKVRSRLMYLESLDSRLVSLQSARNELGDPPEVEGDEPEAGGSTTVQIDEQAVADFCSVMRGLLERWHFLPAGRDVTFDTAKFDFVVDGQARKNNGKGVRALIHAAFNVALMRYCLAKNLPHPRFVILDSPLTTFKEPRQNVRPEDIDEVPGEVQTAFFEDLSKTDTNEQIIVIENKQPPASIKDKIKYTLFVGYGEPGRAGFYPVPKAVAGGGV